MSGAIYGGDEVSGLVFDAGSASFRVGFAGEEYPKGDIPSYVAEQEIQPDADDMKQEEKANTNIKQKRNFFIGTTKLIVPRKNTTVKSFMQDGMVEDFDAYESIMEYAYENILFSTPSEHPVLMTESTWNDKKRREKATELMFEKFQVPAYYVAKNVVLSCFAQGRTHGLMVDSGATQTSVVPVFDGYAIAHAAVRCPLGGDLITHQIDTMLAEQGIEVVPTYKVGTKEEVGEGEPAKWKPRPNLPQVDPSFEKFMRKQVLEDMAANVLQLCEQNIETEYVEKLPSASYSFPNGFNKEFHAERIKIPECMFDLNYLKGDINRDGLFTIAQMASMSANLADIDIRPAIYSNVTATGGNSLILGFTERLHYALATKCPPTIKLRVFSAPTSAERRFGAWIGGSILGSLGTFQQMWISRSEYEDSGAYIVESKCQ